jgi:hypothetical protein
MIYATHTNQLQTDKYHCVYRFRSMKLYNKSKDYIKNKYITHLENNTAVLFKLFHWGGMNKRKKEEHKSVAFFLVL